MGFTIDLKKDQIKARITSDKVLLFAANEAQRLITPYMPMDTGSLMNTRVITPGLIHYKVPYAARCYYDTHLNFQKTHHPLATAKWDKAMMAARGKELGDAVTAFLKRGQ